MKSNNPGLLSINGTSDKRNQIINHAAENGQVEKLLE